MTTMPSGSEGCVGLQPQAASVPSGATSRCPDVKTIIDELLTYIAYYRDRCTSADLHKLIVHFYSPSEIRHRKATFMSEFEVYLSDCQYTTARRQTTTRPAHYAEIEDILGMLELLDNLNVLGLIQVAAVSID
jgi:hypothetical protein